MFDRKPALRCRLLEVARTFSKSRECPHNALDKKALGWKFRRQESAWNSYAQRYSLPCAVRILAND